MVEIPEEYQEIAEYLDQVLARVRERYRRATKLDEYVYRIEAAKRVREAITAGAPRPELKVLPGGLMDDKPVIKDLPAYYATSPRYSAVPRVPQIEPVFSRWENVVLSPIRFFARPEGISTVDRAASVIHEAGVYVVGVLTPAGQKPNTSNYVFCDRADCYEIPFEVDQDGEDWVKFDFSGVEAYIRAAEATDEIIEDCDLHTVTGRVKAFIKIVSTFNLVALSSAFVTIGEAVNRLVEGQNPVPAVEAFPRVFAHNVVAAACKKLAFSPYDEIRVKTVYVCTRANPYVLDTYDPDGTRRLIYGIGGFQYYRIPDASLPPYVPPCGDFNLPPSPGYPGL